MSPLPFQSSVVDPNRCDELALSLRSQGESEYGRRQQSMLTTRTRHRSIRFDRPDRCEETRGHRKDTSRPSLRLRNHSDTRPTRGNQPATYLYGGGPVRYWPSRDPIGKLGGINLYGMVGNETVGRWNLLGLFDLADFNDGDLCGPRKCCFVEGENRDCRKPKKKICDCITIKIEKSKVDFSWRKFADVETVQEVSDGDTIDQTKPHRHADSLRFRVSWSKNDEECKCRKKISYGQGSGIIAPNKSNGGGDEPWGVEMISQMAGALTHTKNLTAEVDGGGAVVNTGSFVQHRPGHRAGKINIKFEAEGEFCFEAIITVRE